MHAVAPENCPRPQHSPAPCLAIAAPSCHGRDSPAVFQVDENGKIARLRRECPSESCGAGVFMASMHDRQYCGKCYTTLVYKQPEDK